MGILERTILPVLPRSLRTKIRAVRKRQIVKQWYKQGHPMPPPHQVKQVEIEDYASKYGCTILVETGTYLGKMIEAEKEYFEKVYSVELSESLWKDAVKKFEKDAHVKLLNGDSGKVLYQLVPTLGKPAIFWLDGHYSGGPTALGEKECPVLEEIDAILADKKNRHVLLVDDARLFNGEHDYPTLEELKKYIAAKNSTYKMEVKDDIIRIIP